MGLNLSIGFLSSISEELFVPLLLDQICDSTEKISLMLFHNLPKAQLSKGGAISSTAYYALPLPHVRLKDSHFHPVYLSISVSNKPALVLALKKWINIITRYFSRLRNHKLTAAIQYNGEALLHALDKSEQCINSPFTAYATLVETIYKILLKNVSISLINCHLDNGRVTDIDLSGSEYSQYVTNILGQIGTIRFADDELIISQHNRQNFLIGIDNNWESVNKIQWKGANRVIFKTESYELVITNQNSLYIQETTEIKSFDLCLRNAWSNFFLLPFGNIGHTPWYIYGEERQNRNTCLKCGSIELLTPFWPKARLYDNKPNTLCGANCFDYTEQEINPLITIIFGEITQKEYEIIKFIVRNLSGRSRSANRSLKSTFLISRRLYQMVQDTYDISEPNYIKSNSFDHLLRFTIILKALRKYHHSNQQADLLKNFQIEQYFSPESYDLKEIFFTHLQEVIEWYTVKYSKAHPQLYNCRTIILEALGKLKKPAHLEENGKYNKLLYDLEWRIDQLIRQSILIVAEIFESVCHLNIWLQYLLLGESGLISGAKHIMQERPVKFKNTFITINN